MTGETLPVSGSPAAPVPDVALAVPRPPLAISDLVTRELAGWLAPPEVDAIAERVRSWPASAWAHAPRVIAMHGLAPHLARVVPAPTIRAVLPSEVRAWIATQDGANELRIRRFHDDLRTILAAAAEGGIAVMPLKGALLTTMPGTDPFRRPMADLDLLVRPGDRAAMAGVLAGLGYRPVPERNPHATHDVFMDPGGRHVSTDGEHADNPRRVELHVEVRRHLWGWVDAEPDEVTPLLWAGATETDILGRRAMVPDPVALAAHLAIHASSDLLVGRGRLVQWLDLAAAAPDLDPAALPHARQAYPAVRLAARAIPGAFAAVDLGRLDAAMPPALVRWATTVPLDHRAGLTAGRSPEHPSGWAARWERWRPEPWRLAVAYGGRSRPAALGRHALTIAGRAVRRG